MCDICMHSPHLPGCPEEPEPHEIGKCALCGDPIYTGEEYAQGMDLYHVDCLENLSLSEWMDIAGLVPQVATEGDW